ncbi:Ppx/GppA family phosphatase [bacterium]|nr:Ppx/GppA family phosphatase [bacterium]
MRIGIIDLGTNSVRLDIHEIREKNPRAKPHCIRLHRDRLMVRLGQGLFEGGNLQPQAIKRTILALKSFRSRLQAFRVDVLHAFATSAVREAKNRNTFLRLVREQTGIEFRILSGEDEAILIAQGIVQNDSRCKGRYALVDIGGGSTEISICRDRKIIAQKSFDLGAARLQQVFLKAVPPKNVNGKDPILALRHHVREELSVLNKQRGTAIKKIIGSSGTIKSLTRITSQTSDTVKLKELRNFIKVAQNLTKAKLSLIPGIEPERADIVLSGAIILEEVLNYFHASKCQVTDFALRDGVLSEEIKALKAKTSSLLHSHLAELEIFVSKLGVDRKYVQQVRKSAELLFESLKPIHRLSPGWKLQIAAAAILHESGKAIHIAGYETHAAYIALNFDFPYISAREREVIAELCLHHAGLKKSLGPFSCCQNEHEAEAFKRALIILRVAHALHQGHGSKITLNKIKQTSSAVTLHLKGKSDLEFERLKLEDQSRFFYETFKRRLQIAEFT